VRGNSWADQKSNWDWPVSPLEIYVGFGGNSWLGSRGGRNRHPTEKAGAALAKQTTKPRNTYVN